jgi:hypothetical protein
VELASGCSHIMYSVHWRAWWLCLELEAAHQVPCLYAVGFLRALGVDDDNRQQAYCISAAVDCRMLDVFIDVLRRSFVD